jgi:hypothetical protein
MSTATNTRVHSGSRMKAILITGLIAGTLDIITAFIVYQANPVRMLQGIAGGAIGRDTAMAGGVPMAAFGLVIHYLIAMAWTVLFFLIYPRLKFLLSKNIILTGLLYGVVVWLGMNLIVIPYLSTIPQGSFNWVGVSKGMAILMVMVGLPVAVLAHRFYSSKEMVR